MTHAIGIDFGTTKSHLAYINRQVVDNCIPPSIARYDREALLTPQTGHFPFFSNERFPSVPTLVNLNQETPFSLRIGFSALPLASPDQPCLALIKDLKKDQDCQIPIEMFVLMV